MRRTLTLLAILIFSAAVGAQQASPADQEALKQANRSMLASYQTKDYEKALGFARQVLDLNLKIFGAENKETATAYVNLGRLYLIREKRREALENYEKAREIYEKDASRNAEALAGAMYQIGNILMSDQNDLDRQKTEKAERMFSQGLEIVENKFGRDSKETLPFLKARLEVYIHQSRDDKKAFEAAQDAFVGYYAATAKSRAADKAALESIDDAYFCFISGLPIKERLERKEKFDQAVANFRVNAALEGQSLLNGKALTLAKPEYPPAARGVRAGGSVTVKIVIDERGGVEKATAICGHPLLRASTVQAALKSKFSPTLVGGKPVKVTGVLIYHFVPS